MTRRRENRNWLQRRRDGFGEEWPNYVAVGAGVLGSIAFDDAYAHDLHWASRILADAAAGLGAAYIARAALGYVRTQFQDRGTYESRPPRQDRP